MCHQVDRFLLNYGCIHLTVKQAVKGFRVTHGYSSKMRKEWIDAEGRGTMGTEESEVCIHVQPGRIDTFPNESQLSAAVSPESKPSSVGLSAHRTVETLIICLIVESLVPLPGCQHDNMKTVWGWILELNLFSACLTLWFTLLFIFRKILVFRNQIYVIVSLICTRLNVCAEWVDYLNQQ